MERRGRRAKEGEEGRKMRDVQVAGEERERGRRQGSRVWRSKVH